MLTYSRLVYSCLSFVFCASASFGAKSSNAGLDLNNLPVVATAVYPFDALMAKRHGKVEVECTINTQGKLVNAVIKKSDGADFSGAVLAYVDATDFSHVVPQAKLGTKLIVTSMTIEFDESKSGDLLKPMTCPSDSALGILELLSRDPTGKKFSQINGLDEKLVLLRQVAPVFPRQLQDKTNKGSALIEFYIDKKGRTQLPRIISATDPAFGYAACQGIDLWEFKPPHRKGRATIVKVRVPVNFTLEAKTS